jgi:SAM-dependent methyltransferase
MIENTVSLECPPRLDTIRGFDRIARLYRPMEYLSFGPLLERCRLYHLLALGNCRRALVIGDGDGRFLAKLLTANPHLFADAVDSSPAMLRLLETRAARVRARDRLITTCRDARIFEPCGARYDLVCTHFFLDCLTESEADHLIARLGQHLAPDAQWLVSEFEVPAGPIRAWLARRVISALYAAFRILTGLAVSEIPPWPAILARHGFERKASRTFLGGLLVSELWQQATARNIPRSHPSMALATEMQINLSSIPGIDPGPEPVFDPPTPPTPDPAPGPAPEPDPMPYPGPIPAPQPVT